MAADARDDFTIAGMLQRFVRLVRRDAINFVLFAVVLGAAPSLLFGALRVSGVLPPLSEDAFALMYGQPLELLLNTVVGLFSQGALISSALKEQSITSGQAGSAGARLIFPLFVIQLATNLLMGLGFLLLVVPGLYLLTRFVLAAPARVDRPALEISEAMGRSAKLTEGHRWKVLAACLIGFTLAIVPPVLAGFAFEALPDATAYMAQELVVAPLAQLMVVVLTSTGLAALYLELRRSREGGAELAEVFA